LAPSCRLLLYTDGLTDSRNIGGEAFTQERLREWLATAASDNAEGLKENLVATLKDFETTSALRDDRTFLVVAEEHPECRSSQDECVGRRSDGSESAGSIIL